MHWYYLSKIRQDTLKISSVSGVLKFSQSHETSFVYKYYTRGSNNENSNILLTEFSFSEFKKKWRLLPINFKIFKMFFINLTKLKIIINLPSLGFFCINHMILKWLIMFSVNNGLETIMDRYLYRIQQLSGQFPESFESEYHIW